MEFNVDNPSDKTYYDYEYIQEQSSLDRVAEWMRTHKSFVVDFETTGLNPLTDEIVLAQIGNTEKQWIIDCRAVNPDPLAPFMADQNYVKLGQNIRFDVQFMLRRGWEVKNVACTMIAEQVARCGIVGLRDVSMKALAAHYLRINLDKDKDLRTSWEKTGIGEFSQRQLEYAAGDVIYPEQIARHQKSIIAERGLRNTLSLEFAVLPVIAKMELEGMRIDEEAWTMLYQKALRERAGAEKVLDKWFEVQTTSQEDMFSDAKVTKSVNYGSWQQVIKAFTRIGYPHLENTDSGYIALEAIFGRIPIELAQALIAYRIYNKRISTYGLGFLEAIEPSTGHIHSDFTQAMTTTGRLSSGLDSAKKQSDVKRVNFQNIPNNQAYRDCFIPDEGDVFIVYDMKAIEPRILGDLSLDPTYVETFLNNGDIYNSLGSKIYGEEVSKAPGRPTDLRKKTKIGILGTSYGTGQEKFHLKMLQDLNLDSDGFLNSKIETITREESDELWEGIFEACPVIRETLNGFSDLTNPFKSTRRIYDHRAASEPYARAYEKLIEIFSQKPKMSHLEVEEAAKQAALDRGNVTFSSSMNGRKRFFKIYNKSFWTEGRNQPIQASASDILKTAMVGVDSVIEEGGYDAAILNQIHDELIIRCKEEQAEELSPKIKDAMEAAGNKFLRVLPCIAEGGICSKWEKD